MLDAKRTGLGGSVRFPRGKKLAAEPNNPPAGAASGAARGGGGGGAPKATGADLAMERPKLEEGADADAGCWKRGAADYNHKKRNVKDKKKGKRKEIVSFNVLYSSNSNLVTG